MSNKPIKRKNILFNSPNRLLYAKILSLASVITLILIIIILASSPSIYGDSPIKIFTNYTVVIPWISLLIFFSLLDLVHDGAFRYDLDKKRAKLDERQLFVRSRIFEKSYIIICSISFFLAVFMPSLGSFGNYNILILTGLAVVVCALPNIIASWQKDV